MRITVWLNGLTGRVIALLLLFSFPVAAQASEVAPVTLRLAYLKGTSDLTLAKARGSLERKLSPMGVKLVWAGPFPAAAPAFEALHAGSVDIVSGSSSSFVTAVAGGLSLSIFAYQPIPAHAEGIVVRKDSAITSLRDLSAKKVAVNRGGTGEYLLARAQEQSALPAGRVVRQYLSPGDSGTAFVAGQVDAWATWDPFLTIAVQRYGGRVLADGARLGSENAVGYFVSQGYLARHRAVVRAVFEVLKQENDWTRTHQAEAGAIWARELGLPASMAERLGRNNVSPLRPVGPAEQRQMMHIAGWAFDNHITPVRADVASHCVNLKP
jgi:sulfonate transport system substrate-binding protein